MTAPHSRYLPPNFVSVGEAGENSIVRIGLVRSMALELASAAEIDLDDEPRYLEFLIVQKTLAGLPRYSWDEVKDCIDEALIQAKRIRWKKEVANVAS